MSMMSEFKTFAMRGNVVDMAVGIIIGGAFGKIVSSFVKDVLMPPIGLALGGVDFSSFVVTLKEAVGDAEAVTVNYGVFLNTVIDFVIVAFAIFMMIKGINSAKKKEEEKPAAPPAPSNRSILRLGSTVSSPPQGLPCSCMTRRRIRVFPFSAIHSTGWARTGDGPTRAAMTHAAARTGLWGMIG